jgi:hypothetical protein
MHKEERRDHGGNQRGLTTKSKTTEDIFIWCHICGLNGHKMIDCPKFIEMQKIFHGKSMTIVEVQLIVEAQTITTHVNVVDVNVATRSKAIKKHVFKDREPRKAKSAID